MITDEYKVYLESEAWKEKRKACFALKGNKCQRCPNNVTLHIHHATYKRIYKERVSTDLYVLCNACHDLYHSQAKIVSIATTKAFIEGKRIKNRKVSKRCKIPLWANWKPRQSVFRKT